MGECYPAKGLQVGNPGRERQRVHIESCKPCWTPFDGTPCIIFELDGLISYQNCLIDF